MAFLIPENLRFSREIPAGHRRVASALAAGLGDHATAWFEPPFDPTGTRPDFVVLDPTLGVVVLVVVDGEVLGTVRGRLRVAGPDGEQDAPDPLEQAAAFTEALREAMAGHPRLGTVPAGGVAVFPGLDRGTAERLDLGAAVDLERCLIKAELSAVTRGDADADTLLEQRFRKALGGGLVDLLEDAVTDELRGLIHPEAVIGQPAAQGSLFSGPEGTEDVIKVMDRQQERLARSLGAGHRVIRGVAGSGKTLVLVHRARLLARLLPTKRILVTCYTRSLASQLREQLAEHDNVEVVNLDKLMARVIRQAGLANPADKGRWDEVPAAALEGLRRLSDGPRYRAVMVDEAQDFDTRALEFCVELLEATDPDEQDLVIVADSAQNIFRRNFTWRQAGIRAQGRTRILRVNYRNTREILAFAHGFLAADPSIEVDEAPDVEDAIAVIPAEAAERSGPEPTVVVVDDVDAEVAAVVAQVTGWFTPRLRARSIAVLMADGRTGGRAERIVAGLEAAGIPTFWVTDPDRPAHKDEAGSADEVVVVSTIHSAKGLEFPRVVVCGFGGRELADEEARITERKQAYVGFTRAVDELAVVTTRDNVFAADLEHLASAGRQVGAP